MLYPASACAVLLLSLSVSVWANDPKPDTPKAEAEEAKEPKKICKRIQSMGSRSSERICMTREEWREYNRGN